MTGRNLTAAETCAMVDAMPVEKRMLVYDYGLAAVMRAEAQGGDIATNLASERARKQREFMDRPLT